VVSVSPAPDSATGTAPAEIRVVFDRAVDAATVNAQTFLLSFSGGDGSFSEGNEVTLFALNLSLTNSRTAVLDLSTTPLPDEFYRLRLVGTGTAPITGTDGTPLDGEFTGTLPSGNGAPGGDFVIYFRTTTAVTALTPAPGSTVAAPPFVEVALTADVNPATLVPASFRLLRAGGDNTFDDGNEVALTGAITGAGTGVFRLDLSAATLPADRYQVTLAGRGAGDAVRCDGVDDYARVPASPQFAPGTGSFSVETWVRLEDATRADGLLECANGDFANGWRLGHAASGPFYFSLNDTVATRTASGGPTPLAGVWYHVAGVYDPAAGETRLYVDGALAATDAGGALGNVNPSVPLFMGKAGSVFLQGSLAEVRLFDVVRTSPELLRDRYRALQGTEPGFVAYWRFADMLGQAFLDTTPNAHTGTLGADTMLADEDPVRGMSDVWPVVRDLDGNRLDGTFTGTLPSGIGLPGVDFVATFDVN